MGRVVLAAVIASVVLGLIVLTVADDAQAGELYGWIGRAWTVTGLWLVFGPVWQELSAPAKAGQRP